MALQKIRLGTNDDGTPQWHYYCPDGHVVRTGPVQGVVTLEDGSQVDVTDDVIEAESPEHAHMIARAISGEPAPTSKMEG